LHLIQSPEQPACSRIGWSLPKNLHTPLRSSALLAILLCTLPATALAQDAPGGEEEQASTIGVSYWKCDSESVSEITQVGDSIVTPIYQELVDEGEILSWGMMTHQWGDEWNVIFYTTAADTPSFRTAFEEAGRRMQERHPDLTPLAEYCLKHKDNIYTLETSTEAPGGSSH
jgi:hypothetical protein